MGWQVLRILRNISVLLLVIIFAFIGTQAIGSLYLQKIRLIDQSNSNPPTSPNTAGKKIVLTTLKQISFSTIQLGSFDEYKKANDMAFLVMEKGYFPQVVFDEGKYKVWLGCFQNSESSHKVKEDLKKLGVEAFVTKGLTNRYNFKFENSNFTKERLAPLLRDYSVALEKCLVLYQDVNFEYYNIEIFQSRFITLQQEIGSLIENTKIIAILPEAKPYQKDLLDLAKQADIWRNSIIVQVDSWERDTFHVSQKECLGMISQYNLILQKNKE